MSANLIQVSDLPSNFPEQLAFYAQHLAAPQRRTVFKELYRGHKKPRYVSELSARVELSVIRVAQEAAKLANIGLLAKGLSRNPTTGKSETYYEKRSEIAVHQARLLRLAENLNARKALSTKRRPQVPETTNRSPRVRPSGAKIERNLRRKLKILYLTATPESQGPLRTDAEAKFEPPYSKSALLLSAFTLITAGG